MQVSDLPQHSPQDGNLQRRASGRWGALELENRRSPPCWKEDELRQETLARPLLLDAAWRRVDAWYRQGDELRPLLTAYGPPGPRSRPRVEGCWIAQETCLGVDDLTRCASDRARRG